VFALLVLANELHNVELETQLKLWALQTNPAMQAHAPFTADPVDKLTKGQISRHEEEEESQR
jgi:hypothetical protein